MFRIAAVDMYELICYSKNLVASHIKWHSGSSRIYKKAL